MELGKRVCVEVVAVQARLGKLRRTWGAVSRCAGGTDGIRRCTGRDCSMWVLDVSTEREPEGTGDTKYLGRCFILPLPIRSTEGSLERFSRFVVFLAPFDTFMKLQNEVKLTDEFVLSKVSGPRGRPLTTA